MVAEYVRNSRAVLDSLNRYEFSKLRVVSLRSDLRFSQTENLGLKLQVSRVNFRLDSARIANATVATRYDDTRARLRASRTENWVWRGAALLIGLNTVANIVSLFK